MSTTTIETNTAPKCPGVSPESVTSKEVTVIPATATAVQDPPKVLPFRNLETPLHYPGLKQGKYPKIAKLIAPYVPDDCTYVDVNLGGGSTLCGFDSYFPCNHIVGNDIDEEVVNFWRVVLDKKLSAELALMVTTASVSLEGWDRAAKLRKNPNATPVERASAFLFLGKTNYRAKVNDGPYGGRNNSDEEARKKLAQNFREPEKIALHIRELHDIWWNRLALTNLDHTDIIREYDKPNHVLCVDPPYLGTEEFYSHKMAEPQAHEKLAKVLRAVKNAFVVLFYGDCPEIRKLYDGCTFHPIENKVVIREDGTTSTSTAQVLILINAREQPPRKERPAPRPNPDLTVEEKKEIRSELEKQEAIITKGELAFVSVGDGLRSVMTKGLFRLDHYSFADYLSAKALDSAVAYRTMNTAKAYHNLCSLSTPVHPRNEWQLRCLVSLDPEEQRAAWLKAVELAHPDHPKGSDVAAVVEMMAAKGAKAKPPTLRLMSDALKRVLKLPAAEATKVAKLICAYTDGIRDSAELVQSFDAISEMMRQNLSAEVSDPRDQDLRNRLDKRLTSLLGAIQSGEKVLPDEKISPTLIRIVKASQLARDVECLRWRIGISSVR